MGGTQNRASAEKARREVMVPTVRFKPGTDQAGATGYVVPKDTRDPRWAACADHHVACDCREAQLAELVAELRDELKRQKADYDEGIAELLSEVRMYRRTFENFWHAAPYEVTRRARIAWTVAQQGMYPHRQTDAAGHDARQKALLRIANDDKLTPEQRRGLALTALGFEPGEVGTPRLDFLEEIHGEPPF